MPGSPIYSSPELRMCNWDNYTIYQNNIHWWGNQRDFEELQQSYEKLVRKVLENYGKIN